MSLKCIQRKWEHLFKNYFKNISLERRSGARSFHKAVTCCIKKEKKKKQTQISHYVSTAVFLINSTSSGLCTISDDWENSVDHKIMETFIFPLWMLI